MLTKFTFTQAILILGSLLPAPVCLIRANQVDASLDPRTVGRNAGKPTPGSTGLSEEDGDLGLIEEPFLGHTACSNRHTECVIETLVVGLTTRKDDGDEGACTRSVPLYSM